MASSASSRVLITGGHTHIGLRLAMALLAENADVTLLMRAHTEDRLGPLAGHVQVATADIWDSASLRGRARGHQSVIHTVGSMVASPQQGLTYHRLNVVSARNAMNMCINDGVSRLTLLSAAAAPWLSQEYVRSKREAEAYIARVGLETQIIRAPLLYERGAARSLFHRLLWWLGVVPPIAQLGGQRIAPMPIDVFVRGVARLALQPTQAKRIYFASDLRRLNTREERRGLVPLTVERPDNTAQTPTVTPDVVEQTPFGWEPPPPPPRRR
jgi:uncharacterized protein YbjT (DUF2867 family)